MFWEAFSLILDVELCKLGCAGNVGGFEKSSWLASEEDSYLVYYCKFMKYLKDDWSSGDPYEALIEEIKGWLRKNLEVKVEWCSWDVNEVVDTLSREALSSIEGLQ